MSSIPECTTGTWKKFVLAEGGSLSTFQGEIIEHLTGVFAEVRDPRNRKRDGVPFPGRFLILSTRNSFGRQKPELMDNHRHYHHCHHHAGWLAPASNIVVLILITTAVFMQDGLPLHQLSSS